MFLLIDADTRRIEADGYLVRLREGRQVNDRERGVITVDEVSAGIADVEFIAEDTQFVGLMAHFDLAGDSE